MSHKKITEMTQEEMDAYIEELRPHLEALARGDQYMLDALADVAGAIVAEAPPPEPNNYVPIAPLMTDSPNRVYFIDPNDLTKSAVLDMSADVDPMPIDNTEELSMFADEEYEALQNALIERHRQRLALSDSEEVLTVDSLAPYDELKWTPKIWTGSD